MRRLSKHHRRVLVYRARRRPISKARRKQQLLFREMHEGTKRAKIIDVTDMTVLTPPSIFSLAENYTGVVDFLSELRAACSVPMAVRRKKRVCADISSISRLDPPAALCLVAELDRWQRLSGTPLDPTTLKNWNPEVTRLLNSAGFFKLLGTTIPAHLNVGTQTSGVKWFRFASHILTDGRAAKSLRQKMDASFGGVKTLRLQLYGPLIEAIKNAVEHAYPTGSLSQLETAKIGPRWWMLGAVDTASRTVNVTVLDLGVSIPQSLPTSQLWRAIGSLILPNLDLDDRRLLSAFEYGRSRTRLPERGKGLPQIVALVEGHPGNQIKVYSRFGYYEAVGSGPGAAKLQGSALPGTLINWQLSLPGQTRSVAEGA